MARSFRAITLAAFAVLLLVGAGGCETGFITNAARSSAAGFLNNVFSTAVSEVIGGN